jgi:hypothetical protein
MNKEIKKTNDTLSDFLEENLTEKGEDCKTEECKLKSKDGLIESTKIINKKVIVEDGRELLREVTFKHE